MTGSLELSSISCHLTHDPSILVKPSPYLVAAAHDAGGAEVRAQTRAVARAGTDVTWTDTIVLDGDFKADTELVVACYDKNLVLADALIGSGAIKIPGGGDRRTHRIQLYDKADKPAGVVTLAASIKPPADTAAGLAPPTPAGVAAAGVGGGALAREGAEEEGGARRRRAPSPTRHSPTRRSPTRDVGAGGGGRGTVVHEGAVVRGERVGGEGGGRPGERGGATTAARRSPSPTMMDRARDTMARAAERVTGGRVGGGGRGEREGEGEAGYGGADAGGGYTAFSSARARDYVPPPGAIEGPSGGVVLERRVLATTEARTKLVERVATVEVTTPVEKRFVVETRYIGEREGPARVREGATHERVVREDAPSDVAAGKPTLAFEGRARGMLEGEGGGGVGGGGMTRRRSPSPVRYEASGVGAGGGRGYSPTRAGGGGGRRSPSPTRATAPRGATVGGGMTGKTVDVPQGPPLTTTAREA